MIAFFLLTLPPLRQKVHLVQIYNIMLLKNSVLKVSDQKKNTMIGGDTVLLSLDDQAQPIYPLVDL